MAKKQKKAKSKRVVKQRRRSVSSAEIAAAQTREDELELVRQEIEQAGVRFLLAKFVDIHCTAKVKMVPAD